MIIKIQWGQLWTVSEMSSRYHVFNEFSIAHNLTCIVENTGFTRSLWVGVFENKLMKYFS